MRFTVVCTASADGELAAIWIAAEDRTAVSAAAREIEKALMESPLDHGESREGNLRILFLSPLGVRYIVHADDRRVIVVQFWTY